MGNPTITAIDFGPYSMTRILILIVSLLVSSASKVLAWGRIHQVLRTGVSQLKLMKGSAGSFDEYRAQLERTYIASYHDDVEIHRADGSLAFREDFGDTLSRVFDDNENDDWTFESMAACGDDCEECVIPENFKVLLDCEKEIDVMALLGIKRAQPLKVDSSRNNDWN